MENTILIMEIMIILLAITLFIIIFIAIKLKLKADRLLDKLIKNENDIYHLERKLFKSDKLNITNKDTVKVKNRKIRTLEIKLKELKSNILTAKKMVNSPKNKD